MDYSDSDGYKAMVARKLTELELSRNDMVKCLDICLLCQAFEHIVHVSKLHIKLLMLHLQLA